MWGAGAIPGILFMKDFWIDYYTEILNNLDSIIESEADNKLIAERLKKRVLKILAQMKREIPNWKIIQIMTAKLYNHLEYYYYKGL
jgi:hypothetical protein